MLSSNGTVLAASAYGNRFTWQGREISWKTSLLHFRSRYYAPTLGRWLSKDKIGISGGENLYAAFENSPVNFRDPFGLLPGDEYTSPTAAAKDAISDINQTSIRRNLEYGGRVFGNPNGTYSYTYPNEGTKVSVRLPPVPYGKSNAGYYHTHAAYDPNFDNENFSPDDKKIADLTGKPAFVGTPSGAIKTYIPGWSLSNLIHKFIGGGGLTLKKDGEEGKCP